MRLLQECRDLIELVLLPGLAAVLPWRICFSLFRRAARWSFLYAPTVGLAYAQAKARGWADNEADWCMQRRLVTLIDHADLYLSWTHGPRWWDRHGRVQGALLEPENGGQLLVTFHWGAGMWGLRECHRRGLHAHALVAGLDAPIFKQRRILGMYARWRTAAVARALGHSVVDTSGSLRPVLSALRQGKALMAAVDVPSDQVQAAASVTLLGRTARMPVGLLRLAVERQLPITVYVTGVDLASGQRWLTIEPIGVLTTVPEAMTRVFERLDALLQAQPAAWHFWSEAERFFFDHD